MNEKEHQTKIATSKLRLMSRAGEDLMGVGGRALKYLRKRGITRGFTPAQSAQLIQMSMLPGTEQVLAGANRGTENMFKIVHKSISPKGRRIALEPLRELKRTNAPDARYSVNAGLREATIPDIASTEGTLADRVRRITTGRHEAREWVRGNAQLARGMNPCPRGGKGFFGLFANPEVGTSHVPGVITDERMFYNGLTNRLGYKPNWAQRQVTPGQYRSPRDIHVGNRPIGYDFDLMREWDAIHAQDKRTANRLFSQIERTPEGRRVLEAANAYAKKGIISPKYKAAIERRLELEKDRFNPKFHYYRAKGILDRSEPLPLKELIQRARKGNARRSEFGRHRSIHPNFQQDYDKLVENFLKGKKSPYTVDELKSVVNGDHILNPSDRLKAIRDMPFHMQTKPPKAPVQPAQPSLPYRLGKWIGDFKKRIRPFGQ